MIRNLLVMVLFSFPVLATANPEEGCMDANYSRIYTTTYKENKSDLSIKVKTTRPEEVSLHTKKIKYGLEIELQNAYLPRERVFIGNHLELREFGASTLLIVKGGKKLLSEKVEGSYLILVVSL